MEQHTKIYENKNWTAKYFAGVGTRILLNNKNWGFDYGDESTFDAACRAIDKAVARKLYLQQLSEKTGSLFTDTIEYCGVLKSDDHSVVVRDYPKDLF